MKKARRLLYTIFMTILIFAFVVPIAFSKQPDDPKPELSITPSSVTLDAGKTQQFNMTVINGGGATPSNVKWQVAGNIGSITTGGLFTAGDNSGNGSVTVSAKVNGTQLSASASVKVIADANKPKPELVIAVNGNVIDEITLKIKEQIQLELQVKNGSKANLKDIEWKVTGNLGTITANGLFIAGDKPGRGAIMVNATINSEKLSANVKLNIAEGENPPGPTKKIVVTVKPISEELLPGGTQQFTIDPKPGAGDTVQWRVIPSRIGSISNNGLFTAGQSTGKGLVIATVQSGDATGTGRASVVVSSDKTKSSPKLDLNVKPEYSRVNVGGSTEFEANIKGIDGTTQYSLEWKVEPSNLGDIQATGTKVTFIAGNTEGKALITAKLKVGTEILTDWAVAEIIGKDKPNLGKFKVAITPDSASLQVGDLQVFAINIIGSSIDLPVSWSWSVAPKKLGTITALSDKTASFTAIEPGWGMIIAKADNGESLSVGQAKIYISGKNDKKLKLAIIPQTAETQIGGSPVEFRLIDLNGNPLTGVSVSWKAVPEKLGNLVGNVLTATYTPDNKTGHVLITAKIDDGKGYENAQARLTITDQKIKGKLNAIVKSPQSINVNETGNYEVSVTDSNGKQIDMTGAKIEWRVVPSKLGTFNGTGSAVQFTPTVVGRGVIMVDVETSQGKVTGRLSITVDKK
jgi:hypothetical protein